MRSCHSAMNSLNTMRKLRSINDIRRAFVILLTCWYAVQNVVRKVERQYLDIAGSQPAPLKVNEGSVETFLRRFSWVRFRTR
jgi:hypothetical protein